MTDLALVHGAPAAPRGLVSRATRWAGSAILAAGLLAGSNGVLAANADITVTVAPVPTAVSVSRAPMTSYAAYTVLIQNNTGNVINQVVFGGRSAVCTSVDSLTGACEAPLAVSTASNFKESDLCTVGATPNSFQCSIGQLKAFGKFGSSASFVVLFSAPPLSLNGTSIAYGSTASIQLAWNGDYSSGNSSSTPTSLSCNTSTDPSWTPGVCTGTVSTGLVTTATADINSKLNTYIPNTVSSTFFTGNNASATMADTSTTLIKIPAGLRLTTANVDEKVFPTGLTNDTLTNNETTITIPTSNPFGQVVTFELRRDSSTIRSFNAINRVPLYYEATAGEPYPTLPNPGMLLQDCAAVNGPDSANPVCIDQRAPLSKKNATGDDIGDWKFILKALQNGIARW